MTKVYSGFAQLQFDTITVVKTEEGKKVVLVKTVNDVDNVVEFVYTKASYDRAGKTIVLVHEPSGELRQIITDDKTLIDQFAE